MIITDTFGRPWREGQVNFAVGVSGMEGFRDYRGAADSSGQVMAVTNIAEVDEIAAAAELVMGKVDGVPAAIVRGHPYLRGDGGSRDSSAGPLDGPVPVSGPFPPHPNPLPQGGEGTFYS